MPYVARTQGESIFGSSGCDHGVAGSEPVRQRIFLNINGGPMANILAQRENPEAIFTQEAQDILMLTFFPRPPKQLHIGQNGNTALFFPFDQRCSPMVPSLDPNEDVGIKEHRIDPP